MINIECILYFLNLAGEDYEAVNGTLSIPEGSTNGTVVRFRVPIIDDDCFEKDEYFWVHIYAVERNIHIYRHRYVTVHIYSDDGKLIVIT